MVTKEYFGSFADGTVYAYTLKNQGIQKGEDAV